MKFENIDIQLIAHATFRIAGSKVVIYVDPFRVRNNDEADIVLLSHEHFDHMSPDDLNKVIYPGSTIVASPTCRDGLKKVKVKALHYLDPGGKHSMGNIEIFGCEAYNLDKGPEPGKLFHPPGEKRLGFLIKMDGVTVYHAGDADFIPEMRSIECDVALLPVSGTYVMTPEEAAQAADAIKAKVTVPMHYGAVVGSRADAEKFKSLVKNSRVEIL